MKSVHKQGEALLMKAPFMTIFGGLIRPFSTINTDKILLERLNTLVKELRSTNSINSKIEMIKNKPELRPILELIYSPESRFYITSNSITSLKDTPTAIAKENDLNSVLKILSNRLVTGKAAVSLVKEYIKLHPEYEELIKNIIDKNLRARIGHDLIKRSFDENDVKKKCIACSLGYPITKHLDYLKKSLANREKWFISRKYDGIRVFVVYNFEDQSLKLLTRQMKPIFGLNLAITNALRESLKELQETIILDGELVYMLEDREDFSKTISVVKSIEPKPIDGLQFRAFDIITDHIFSIRQETLQKLFKKYFSDSDLMRLVDQEIIDNSDSFNYDELIEKSTVSGYEGFMIRRDCELKDGRSRDLLKIKPFQDSEFKVIDYEIGPMRLLDAENMEKTETVLLSVTIDFNGNRVNVGSGFSHAERIEFARYPEKILNKTVTIRYQSESKVEGRRDNSLRFPVFKVLHGNKRTE